MKELDISWTEFKTIQGRGFAIYHLAFPQAPPELEPEEEPPPTTYHYEVYGVEGDRFYRAPVAAPEEVDDFETNYLNVTPAKTTAVSSRDAVIALTPPPVNSLGAMLVETTSRLSQLRSLTIVTHDFSEPTTWWQNSTQVEDEELTYEGEGVYSSAHPLWINVEHPKVFADEQLDVGLWAGAGYPGMGDPFSDLYSPFYRSWWMPDASLALRNHFYPVIQVQVGGVGDWLTKAPDDATYGHTFDYTLGAVHFEDNSGWEAGTKVRATYFYTVVDRAHASFWVGPPAGKVWHLTRTEVQLTKGASWQDTIHFYGLQNGVPGTRARYKTYGNMQSTATSSGSVILDGGIAEEPQAWPACADNGWMHGGCTGLRNHTKPIEVDPWEYKKPFEFFGSLGMKVAVTLADGKEILTADIANVTFYVDEFDET